MLQKVSVYSSFPSVPPLVLNFQDISEDDLYKVRNLDGLGPVKASISTTPLGSSRGSSYGGSSVGERNLVFTLGFEPDWGNWTITKLRRNLDTYFMPQSSVTLIFESEENSPVVISGYVEANEPSIFSKDPEQQVSIICPDPDFVAVDPVTITGLTTDPAIDITYNGTQDTGIGFELTRNSGTDASALTIALAYTGQPPTPPFQVSGPGSALIDATHKFVMSSVTKAKYAQQVRLSDGLITNLLPYVTIPPKWPKLVQGINNLDIVSNNGVQNWSLTYYERYGSL